LTTSKDGGGGGGGGYSGGGGGANQGDGAGGGGSYVSGDVNTTLSLAVAGYRSGDGLVEITPVNGSPVITQPKDQQVAIGQQAVTLGPVFNDPTGQTTYQWLKDGVVLVGQTSATLSIASFQFTDSGGYQAIVQQGSATFITQPAFLSPSTPLSTLQGWGSNGNGELGQGNTNVYFSPVQVERDVLTMTAGSGGNSDRGYSLFVKRDGTLWAVGMNDDGQLGLGDKNTRNSPEQVTSDVVTVAAGSVHSLFVKRDGTLWAMGYNSYGQLGLGDTNDRLSPVQVTGDVVAVAAGAGHSLFVKRDGTLWGTGDNSDGQLGLGNTGQSNLPVQLAGDVVAVAAGVNHTLFVKRDGTLWAMGDNSYGQLGLGDNGGGPTLSATDRRSPVQVTGDVVAVVAGYQHSLFVKRDGSLWGMGYNRCGQLGLGDTTDRNLPSLVTTGVVAVAAGNQHSLFVKRDGSLWAVGDNQYGELGLGYNQISVTPANGGRSNPAQVYFRNSANQPTTALVVATLPKMPLSWHTLAITAPVP
jgi:alpha-tubulin suppressor-like RCC1 family protein